MVGVNPYCACGHTTRNHASEGIGPCQVPDCACKLFNNPQNPLQEYETESHIVLHARAELARINEDKEFKEGVIEIVKIFAKQGHSGSSAPIAVDIIYRLLQQKALTPLTDNPDEWYYHNAEVWGQEGGVWQNKRDSRAFSTDCGNNYWFVDDASRKNHSSMRTPEGEIARNKRFAQQ